MAIVLVLVVNHVDLIVIDIAVWVFLVVGWGLTTLILENLHTLEDIFVEHRAHASDRVGLVAAILVRRVVLVHQA